MNKRKELEVTSNILDGEFQDKKTAKAQESTEKYFKICNFVIREGALIDDGFSRALFNLLSKVKTDLNSKDDLEKIKEIEDKSAGG